MVNKTKPAPRKQTASKGSKTAATNTATTTTTTTTQPADLVDTKHQQRLLDIFAAAFSGVLSSDALPARLQEIKQALYIRDFAAAFGREDYLEAYAARWSPTRALCYEAVFSGVRGYLEELLVQEGGGEEEQGTEACGDGGAAGMPLDNESPCDGKNSGGPRLKMLSIGGCAAEHLAFASYLYNTANSGSLTLVDSAPWSITTSLLQTHITTPPTLSRYASASARASNTALLDPSRLNVCFTQRDVLAVDDGALKGPEGLIPQQQKQPLVVTLLFTLNELYTEGGIGKTTKLFKRLGEALPHGSLLLVVDSPGSYSEAAVGKEKKRYPMHWLLDHTLLETETKGGATWEKLESQDSAWFRLPEGLTYPIQLENMRYQMHLYKVQREPVQ